MYEKEKSKDKTSLIVAIAAIILTLGGVFLLNQSFSTKKKVADNDNNSSIVETEDSEVIPSSFEECQSNGGSVLVLTSSKKCTLNGLTFSRTISPDETTQPSDNPPDEDSDNPSDGGEGDEQDITVTTYGECELAGGATSTTDTQKVCIYNGDTYTEDLPQDPEEDPQEDPEETGLMTGNTHAELMTTVSSIGSDHTIKFTVTETGFEGTRWLQPGSYFFLSLNDWSSYSAGENYIVELIITDSQVSGEFEILDVGEITKQ